MSLLLQIQGEKAEKLSGASHTAQSGWPGGYGAVASYQQQFLPRLVHETFEACQGQGSILHFRSNDQAYSYYYA